MMNELKNQNIEEDVFYSIILESDQADSVLDLMKKNINLVVDFFDLDGGAIYLLENKNANLFLNFNLSPSFVKNFNYVEKNSFIFKQIFKHTAPFVSSGRLKTKFKDGDADYATMIIVPILYGKKAIGFYIVASNQEKGFEQRDVKLMSLIAKEIGSFVEQVISDVSIKKEKKNFKSFFNLLQDIIIVTDSSGSILEANNFALESFKYERNYFLQRKIFDFWKIEKEEEAQRIFFQLLSNQNSIFLLMAAKGGDFIPVEINSIKGIWDEKEAYFLTAKDLSKAKEAERKLKENKELYSSLVSNIPNYILICNKNEKIVYTNGSVLSALGYKENEMVNRDIWSVVAEDSKKILQEEIKNSLSKQKSSNCEIKLVSKNKGLVDVIVSGAIVKYDEEDAFLLVMTDITNRKKIENLLIEKTNDLEDSQKSLVNVLEDVEEEKNRTMVLAQDLEKFRLAVENASDHIVITDSNGILLYSNKGTENITGFSSSEVVGSKCGSKENWGGMMDRDFYRKLWKTIKTEKKSFSGEMQNKRKDGSTYVASVNISPVLNDKKEVLFFVCIERDITKEKEIDKAKSEFVSLASHQLRTPLSIINWYAEMLLGGDAGTLNDNQRDYLNEIMTGNNRMIDLVGALLNVSRIEMGTFAVNPIKSDLIKIAKGTMSELLIKAKQKNIDLVCDYGKNIPLINVDHKLFSIVIDNLVGNAIKYTPDGGKVSLKIKKEQKGVLITVSDNGYGILKKDKDKIFTKLFRGENAKEKEADGNGLGLYIAKSIIEQSGGKIWFDSRENKGTTFYILLPFSGMKKKKGSKELAK
jgi:PAS domain S-box-containing protein